jgi:16S rRNA processing protein RimM
VATGDRLVGNTKAGNTEAGLGLTKQSLTSHLPVGAIVGAQGIKGQFKVKPFTSTPDALAAYGPVILDDGRQIQLRVTSVNAKGLAIVRAKGVDTRDAAEALRGTTLYVAREQLPDLDDDEIYHADLLGMMVSAEDGKPLGKIVAIHDFGAGEIAELAPDKGPTIMVPFGGENLITVDIKAGKIGLLVPDGLLDDQPE